jgi:hypothetical protein
VDGRIVTGAVARSAGGPDTPLTDEQLDAKFLGNAGPAAAPLIAVVRRIEELDSLAPLTAALRAAP